MKGTSNRCPRKLGQVYEIMCLHSLLGSLHHSDHPGGGVWWSSNLRRLEQTLLLLLPCMLSEPAVSAYNNVPDRHSRSLCVVSFIRAFVTAACARAAGEGRPGPVYRLWRCQLHSAGLF